MLPVFFTEVKRYFPVAEKQVDFFSAVRYH